MGIQDFKNFPEPFANGSNTPPGMKLHIEYTPGCIIAHLVCSKRPAEFFGHVEPSRFSCLIQPNRLSIDQEGLGCALAFNIDGYSRLIARTEGVAPAGGSTYLPEKELQHFILSAMELVHHKYNSSYLNSANQPYTVSYLNLINAKLVYFDNNQSLRIISPLFFCSDEVCAEVSECCFGDEYVLPNLNAVEKELLSLGRLLYNHIAAFSCAWSPLLLYDSVLHTVKHHGYSRELGQLLSALLSLQCDRERFWSKLLSSSYADFTFLSSFNFSSFKSYDAVDFGVNKDVESSIAVSFGDKLNTFLLSAQSLCNNTFRASNYSAEDLLPFLTDEANIARMIDYIYASSEASGDCSDDIFFAGDPDTALSHEECLNVFLVLLRHNFETFTLQDVILHDTELARRLLSLSANPSRRYLGTFKRIITSLLITRQSTLLLLSAYAQQLDLFEQLIFNIQYEEVAGVLLTLIDLSSQFDDERLNSLIVYCASRANLCNRLISAICAKDCVPLLLSAMHLYEQLFNSHCSGLLTLAVSGLPSLLTILEVYATELHATAEVTADMSLFVCTCFNECGKVLSIGLSLIFKTALGVSTESFDFVLSDLLLRQEIDIVYPRIAYRLAILTKRLVHFIDKATDSYPAIVKQVHTPRLITYLYHYLTLYARVFSVTADLKTYLYFTETGAKPPNEFNGKTQHRDSLHRVAEPLLEAPMPYSARAGSGGPSEIAVSATYLSKHGSPLPISLRNLALELLDADLIKGMCKLFYSYPDATTLHFVVGRILIPYVELFIWDPEVLNTICLQSSFISVGQEFVEFVDHGKSPWSSGLTHYVNLFRSIVRLAGGISDKILFTVDWKQLRPKIFEKISNRIPFSIKKLAATVTHEPSPTIKYLLQARAIADLSTRILDYSHDEMLSKLSNLAAESSTDDLTDSSTILELTASNIDSTFLGAIVNSASASPPEDSQEFIQTDNNARVSFIEELVISHYDFQPLDGKGSHS